MICLLAVMHSSAQQSIVQGVVSIFNSETETGKRQYVSNAQVEDNFGKAQPTVTTEKGQFKLVYVTVQDNSPVSINIKKPPLQVVNIDALNATAGQNEPIKITMAHPDSIAEYRRRIYQVGKTEAEKNLEKLIQSIRLEIADARRKNSRDVNRLKQLEQQLLQSEEKQKNIDEQAQELANKYTPVNLDDASPIFRRSFLLFQHGNLDSAIALLEKANLSGHVNAILTERKRIHLLKNEIEERDSIEKKRTSDIQEALQLKADFHKTKYEFDSAALLNP